MDMSVKLSLSYPAAKPAVEPSAPVSPKSDDSSVVGASQGTDTDKLKAAVSEIEKFVQSAKRNLEFSIDETSGIVVVKVIASESGEVVRQIPSEEALKLADSLSSAGSVLFDGKA